MNTDLLWQIAADTQYAWGGDLAELLERHDAAEKLLALAVGFCAVLPEYKTAREVRDAYADYRKEWKAQ